MPVAQTGWPQGQQDAFLAMQAKAQHEHYLLHYPEAERHLIELSGETAGRLYLSDPEHSRIVQMQPDGSLLTLIQGDALRWPDGFSFGPDGDLYIACSALHQVLGRLPWQIHAAGPFPLYRLPLGVPATPGH